jgi:hypothetical protein
LNRAGAGFALKFSPRDVGGAASFWALAAGTPHRQSMAVIATAPNPNAPLVGRFITGNRPPACANRANASRISLFNP